jgi:hypothetical protein
MSSKTQSVYDEGIECTPDSLYRGIAGCFGFLLTCLVTASFGIIAGGVFWTAQNMDRITDKGHFVLLDLQGS